MKAISRGRCVIDLSRFSEILKKLLRDQRKLFLFCLDKVRTMSSPLIHAWRQRNGRERLAIEHRFAVGRKDRMGREGVSQNRTEHMKSTRLTICAPYSSAIERIFMSEFKLA